MATNESSGRWDATGSFEDAVSEQQALAREWVTELSNRELTLTLSSMAKDPNAFTLYERRAVLEWMALRLGMEL